jgi:hypothetical protein
MKAKKKQFDAVEMKCKIQDEIYEETKNMTPEEEGIYIRKSVETGPFAAKVRRIRARQQKKQKAS